MKLCWFRNNIFFILCIFLHKPCNRNRQLLIKFELSCDYIEIKWYQLSMKVEHIMMTSSNGNIFRVTGPMCGEFTGPGEFLIQRPVLRSFDIFFDLRLNRRLSKQPWGWWFEIPSWSLWRLCNVLKPDCSGTTRSIDTVAADAHGPLRQQVITLRPRQNGRHIADDTFKPI